MLRGHWEDYSIFRVLACVAVYTNTSLESLRDEELLLFHQQNEQWRERGRYHSSLGTVEYKHLSVSVYVHVYVCVQMCARQRGRLLRDCIITHYSL